MTGLGALFVTYLSNWNSSF